MGRESLEGEGKPVESGLPRPGQGQGLLRAQWDEDVGHGPLEVTCDLDEDIFTFLYSHFN